VPPAGLLVRATPPSGFFFRPCHVPRRSLFLTLYALFIGQSECPRVVENLRPVPLAPMGFLSPTFLIDSRRYLGHKPLGPRNLRSSCPEVVQTLSFSIPVQEDDLRLGQPLFESAPGTSCPQRAQYAGAWWLIQKSGTPPSTLFKSFRSTCQWTLFLRVIPLY